MFLPNSGLTLDLLGGTALVYRYAGYVFGVEQKKPYGIIEQLWEQMKAKNVNQFKDAVARQQMPMFTYIYADHNGDTFYQSNSWTPDYSGPSKKIKIWSYFYEDPFILDRFACVFQKTATSN